MTVGDAHRSLRDAVVDELRRMILAGDFEAGMRMKEEVAAEKLGVSRLPVREAFRRLEAEGLLQTGPGRGVTVTPPDADELAVMHAVRVRLELIAVDLIIRRNDPATMQRIGSWLQDCSAADRGGDTTALRTLNAEFHDLLCEASGSTYLETLLTPVRNRVHLLHRGQHQSTEQSWHEHEPIARSILAGDAATAAQLIRTHFEALAGETGSALSPA